MKVVEAQATKFVCSAYGKVNEPCSTLTECRVRMWKVKTGKSGTSSLKLCSLPPTTNDFVEHVRRCHLQVATWKAALLESPPELDATQYGWELDHQGVLQPRTVVTGTLYAPPSILQLIRCQCKTSGCRTAACNCSKLGCTMVCLFEGGEACMNPLTRNRADNEDDDDEEEEENIGNSTGGVDTETSQ